MRNLTEVNSNGTLASTTLSTLLVDNVQNLAQSQPLFTWSTSPTITQSFPLNVQTVYINLILEVPGNKTTAPNVMTLMATCPRMNF
jgi:hypothetical protein